jgi:hypothetical protein
MLQHSAHRSVLPLGSRGVCGRSRLWPAGQVVPLVALVIVVLLGSIALGTDVAVHYYNWVQMQKAADAGVLAGANSLPDNPSTAISTAKQYAELNGVASSEITSTTVASNDLSISMTIKRTVPYYFAKVLGLSNGTLQVSAAAAPQAAPECVGCSGPPGSPNNPTPAACDNTGDCQVIPIGLDVNTTYSNGEQIVLQQGQVGPGNWDLLALGGVGGNNLRTNIADGYSGYIAMGQWVTTEPGKKVGPVDQGFQDRMDAAATSYPDDTYSSFNPNNPRVMVLPVVNWEGQNGRSQVEVDAFATVWLDSYNGGQVTVNFISTVVANSFGDPSAPNFGGHGHPTLTQ